MLDRFDNFDFQEINWLRAAFTLFGLVFLFLTFKHATKWLKEFFGVEYEHKSDKIDMGFNPVDAAQVGNV